MNNKYHRKLLRLTTWVALTVGLSLSTSAIASSPPTSGPLAQGSPTETEGMQQDTQQQDSQAQDQQASTDLPSEITDFAELVNQREQEGIDDIYGYVDEGTNSMADAIGALLPDEDQAESLKTDLDNWKDRLDIVGHGERPDFASLTSVLFGEGADVLERVQQQYYPDQASQVQQVRSAANSFDGEGDIQNQQEAVHNYFSSAATAIQQMYTTHGEQVTSSLSVDLIPVVAPGALAQAEQPQQQQPQQQPEQPQPQQEDDQGFFEDLFSGDGIPRQVENFEEFVQQHREQGIDHVADYTRQGAQHYHDAIKSLVDEGDQEMDLINEHLADFQQSVDSLDTTPRLEYPTNLVNVLNEGTLILTSIQQSKYPQLENQVREIENSIAMIDTGTPIEQQVDAIQNVFIQASASLRSMAEVDAQQQEEPVSLARDGGTYEGSQPMDQGQDQPMDQGQDQIGSGPQVSPGVQEYTQYVDNLRQSGLEQQGEQSVVQGMELLSEAIAGIVENTSSPGPQEQPGLPDQGQQPGQQDGMDNLEPMQYSPDDPAAPETSQPGQDWEADMPRQANRQNLDQEFQAFNDSIEQLKQAQGRSDFSSVLKDTTDAAVQLLTSVQEQSFPSFGTQIQQIRSDAERIDANTELLEQTDQVLSFFTSTADFLSDAEAKQREDLQVSLRGVVLLQ